MSKLLISSAILGLFLTTACSPKNQGAAIKTSTESTGIIGGTAVTSDDPISHQAALVITLNIDTAGGKTRVKSFGLCTGNIFSDSIIVTAGHCAASNPKTILVYFSTQIPTDWKTFFQTFHSNPLVRQVQSGVTAPQWKDLNDSTVDNWGDISVLKFNGGLPEGYSIANMAETNTQLSAHQPITLAGFGLTDGVNQVHATELRKATVEIDNPNYSQTELLINNLNNKGACHGDSGGPAYITEADGSITLVGITSRADVGTDPKGECVGKTVYTKIGAYLDWIQSESNKLDNDPTYGLKIEGPEGLN